MVRPSHYWLPALPIAALACVYGTAFFLLSLNLSQGDGLGFGLPGIGFHLSGKFGLPGIGLSGNLSGIGFLRGGSPGLFLPPIQSAMLGGGFFLPPLCQPSLAPCNAPLILSNHPGFSGFLCMPMAGLGFHPLG